MKTLSKTGTKVSASTIIVAAVVAVAGLGLFGIAAGLVPLTKGSANLTVQATTSVSSVENIDDLLIYTIIIKNTGSVSAKAFSVTDRYANSGLSLIAATSPTGTCSAVTNTITCAMKALAPSKTAIITVQTKVLNNIVPCGLEGSILSLITLDTTGAVTESNETDNSITTTTVENGSCENSVDLSIEKAGDVDSVEEKDSVSYTITVNNTGKISATGIKVTDVFSSDIFVYSNAVGTNSFSCSQSGNTVTCDGGMISAESSATITLVGIIGDAELECNQTDVLTDVATVDPENTVKESFEENNTATVSTILANVCSGTTTTTSSTGGLTPVGSGTSTTSGLDKLK